MFSNDYYQILFFHIKIIVHILFESAKVFVPGLESSTIDPIVAAVTTIVVLFFFLAIIKK